MKVQQMTGSTKITSISSQPATPHSTANHSPDQILRLPEVIVKCGISSSMIYDLMKKKEFPQSIPLGGRHKGWSMNELDGWIASRKALRIVAA